MAKSKVFKNCLALLLITLVAGLALAVVNEITAKPISEAENKAKMAAYESVFSGVEFEEINSSDKLIKAENDSAPVQNASVDDVLRAVDKNGNTVGYVISASGYGGDVKIAIGISAADDKITGFKVLSHSETAGLGAKCTEDDFQNQFAGKSAGKLSYVKNAAASDSEIDAISGATITSSAVTDAVNAATHFYSTLKEGQQ